jgi:protein phosphatase
MEATGESESNFLALFNCYRRNFLSDPQAFEQDGFKLSLPICPFPILVELCDAVTELFKAEPMVLELNKRTAIVGDLHGHVVDLFRQVGKLGLPPACNYLFLGDLVDRGEFSTETTVVILLMKALWPENVYCIRGNHEFGEMSSHGGFGAELHTIYGEEKAEEAILACFSYMPIAALIGTEVLCVHGGIGPGLFSMKQLSEIQRPLTTYDDDLVQGLLWSDPAEFVSGFQPSSRGIGYFFGPDALAQFLDQHHLKYLVRGHEVVEGGIENHLERRMTTVFGASNYCGLNPNKAAVMVVHPEDGKREVALFTPLKYFKRAQARFLTSESDTVFRVKSNRTPSGPKVTVKSPGKPGVKGSVSKNDSVDFARYATRHRTASDPKGCVEAPKTGLKSGVKPKGPGGTPKGGMFK